MGYLQRGFRPSSGLHDLRTTDPISLFLPPFHVFPSSWLPPADSSPISPVLPSKPVALYWASFQGGGGFSSSHTLPVWSNLGQTTLKGSHPIRNPQTLKHKPGSFCSYLVLLKLWNLYKLPEDLVKKSIVTPVGLSVAWNSAFPTRSLVFLRLLVKG